MLLKFPAWDVLYRIQEEGKKSLQDGGGEKEGERENELAGNI